MIYRARINSQFETVASFSAHHEENWNVCLTGLNTLALGHVAYEPTQFPGVNGVYSRDADPHTRFIHYWTKDEELSYSKIMLAGFDIVKGREQQIETEGAAVLQLVTANFNSPNGAPLPEKHTVDHQTYGSMPISIPARVGVA